MNFSNEHKFSRRFYYQLIHGKPDMIFPKYQAVLFVHGCFWHFHGCKYSKIPSSRAEWWRNKPEGNQIRDRKNVRKLLTQGWRVKVVWECSIKKFRKNPDTLIDKIVSWLEDSHISAKN